MKIRASMLPSYTDCPRRAVARQYSKVIEEAGFELRRTLPTVGAACGTAVHAVARDCFLALMAGEAFNFNKAVDSAMDAFKEETEPGATWDDSTPRPDVARQQIERMSQIYLCEVGSNLTSLAVELPLNADLGDGWILTGHIDLVTKYNDEAVEIRDLKTGGVKRAHFAQVGAYSLLYRSAPPEGLPGNVAALGIDFIHRTPKTRPQKEPESTKYPVALSEREAFITMHRLKREMIEFQNTGSPEIFPCNFQSMLCTPIYCPAYGTFWCSLSQVLSRK